MILKRLLFIIIVSFSFICMAEFQVWRSVDGSYTFRGEIVRIQNGLVTLRGSGGEEVSVPLDRLDEESRLRARKTQLRPEQRQNLVYFHETPNYRLTLHSERSVMRMEVLDRGKETPHPLIRLDLSHFEVHRDRRVQHDFRTMDRPVERNGNTVIWRGKMSNDVVFEFIFVLEDEGVNFGYRRETPANSPSEIGEWVATIIPAWLSLNEETGRLHGSLAPEGIQRDQLEDVLSDFRLRFRSHDNQSLRELRFTEYFDGTLGRSRQYFIQIQVPFLMKNIELTSPRREENGVMSLQTYESGRPLYMITPIGNIYPGYATSRRNPGMFGIHFR